MGSTTDTTKLVQEFQKVVGLPEAEARRSAFLAFAHARGWSNARIGRYLGVSRHRVGQKLTKAQFYAANGKMPTLKKVLKERKGTTLDPGSMQVAFQVTDWDDERFARGMLKQVVS